MTSVGVSGYRLAAMIMINKSIIIGTNEMKSNPEFIMIGKQNRQEYSTSHAEMNALFKAKRKLGQEQFDKQANKIKIFVLRLCRKNKISMAKPCQFCEQKLLAAGLKKKNIYYTNQNGEWEQMK